MQLSRKSVFLVFSIYALLLAALFTRRGEVLLLAFPLFAYLLVGLVQAPAGVHVRVDRRIDKPTVVAQEPVEIKISVENQGEDTQYLSLQDEVFPEMALLAGQPGTRMALPSGRSASFSYTFEASRNIFIWQNIRVAASDPLGLFEAREELPAPGEVLVRPAAMQIRPVTLKPRATLHAAGPVLARLAGAGTDFWGVREYRPGDDFRWINWRSTNRHPNKMFTNEFEREEIADYGIILDGRTITESDLLESEIFEYSVSAVSALSEVFLRMGNRVSLLVLGKPVLQVFPGYGKGQLNKLLVTLSHASLGAQIRFRNLDYFPTQLFPRRSMLLVVSLVGPRDLKAYSRMKAYGYDVLLISPNLAAHAAQARPESEVNALAYRVARVERTLQLQEINKLGVNVIDWQIEQSLEPVLRKVAQAITYRRKF